MNFEIRKLCLRKAVKQKNRKKTFEENLVSEANEINHDKKPQYTDK